MSCTTSFAPDIMYNTLSANCPTTAENAAATCVTDPTCAAGYNDGGTPVVATCDSGAPGTCIALRTETTCAAQAPCRWDAAAAACEADLTLSGCSANQCAGSDATTPPWRDTPGYVITSTCGSTAANRETGGINCDDTTCAAGYVGEPVVTCPVTGVGLRFSGCTRDIQGSLENESKKSDFHNDYDGAIDISWKNILGGLFFLFIFVAIMGFVKKKHT